MLTVKVTQDHIDKGRHGTRACPLSLALRDALGVSYNPSVADVYFRFPEYGAEYDLPANAIAFRRAFDGIDRKYPVEPFEFSIPDPRE